MTFADAIASAEAQYQQQRAAYVAALSLERMEAIKRNAAKPRPVGRRMAEPHHEVGRDRRLAHVSAYSIGAKVSSSHLSSSVSFHAGTPHCIPDFQRIDGLGDIVHADDLCPVAGGDQRRADASGHSLLNRLAGNLPDRALA